jgi:hypothetical protein
MTDDRAKTPRTLLVADHLWEAFSLMAAEMGNDRDALVNQALYTFARLNGFLVPGDLRRLTAQLPPVPLTAVSQPIESSRPRPKPGPPTLVPGNEERPSPPERMAEVAQQPGSAPPDPQSASTLPVARSGAPSPVEVDDSLLGEEAQVATSMDLPSLAAALGGIKQPALAIKSFPPPSSSSPPSEDSAASDAAGNRALVLLAEGRELDRVVKERFLIGRGKHCDLIINSGKVSREHAAITREGPSYFIEDLGSSNGTWFDKRRISRRQIQDGDEYFICSEKLSCAFR